MIIKYSCSPNTSVMYIEFTRLSLIMSPCSDNRTYERKNKTSMRNINVMKDCSILTSRTDKNPASSVHRSRESFFSKIVVTENRKRIESWYWWIEKINSKVVCGSLTVICFWRTTWRISAQRNRGLKQLLPFPCLPEHPAVSLSLWVFGLNEPSVKTGRRNECCNYTLKIKTKLFCFKLNKNKNKIFKTQETRAIIDWDE